MKKNIKIDNSKELNMNVNEQIRECVFSVFKDKVNKNYDYETYLNNMKKDELIQIFAYLALISEDEEVEDFCTNKNKYSKKELIDYILANQQWIVDSILGNILSSSFESLNSLVELFDKDGYYEFNYQEEFRFNIQILVTLNVTKLGFINTSGDMTQIHIPKDLLKIIKNSLNDEDVIDSMQETDELATRIEGLLSIYGVMKLSDIFKLDAYFRDYTYYDLEFICYKLKVNNMGYELATYDDDLIIYSGEFDNKESAIEILNLPLEYKKYDNNFLEKFYDNKYIEELNPYKEIKKILKKLKFTDDDFYFIKGFVIDSFISTNQLDSNKAKKYYFEQVYTFSNDEEFCNIMLEYAIKIADKYPRWELKGDIKQSKIVKVDKIGRNDLCSCGSGKKYKKCCGK